MEKGFQDWGALCLAAVCTFPSQKAPRPALAKEETPPRHLPALVARADQVVLLHAVREELRPAKRQADLGEELRQTGLSLLPVVPHPGQGGFEDLPREKREAQGGAFWLQDTLPSETSD